MVVIDLEMVRIAVDVGIAKEVVDVRVVLEPRVFNLHRIEVDELLEHDERVLLGKLLDRHEVLELDDEILDRAKQRSVGLFNRGQHDLDLFISAEESTEFLKGCAG